MAAATATDPAIVALREALERRLEELSDQAAARIFAEIPAYRDCDEHLRRDVRAHVLSHLHASLVALDSGRDVTREDLLFIRPHAARRARRVSVTEFVQAFYIGERVLWDAALALAHDDDSRRAALAFATHLPRYFEVATTHAAEVYLETQEQLAATGERIRRDLLEDLLAGREPEPGRGSTPPPRPDCGAAIRSWSSRPLRASHRATKSCCAAGRSRWRAPPAARRSRSPWSAAPKSSWYSRRPRAWRPGWYLDSTGR